MVRATSSLPVPVSPKIHTRDSLAATRSSCAITRRMASPFHTISCLPRRWRSCLFSLSKRCNLSAFSTVSMSLSLEIGFSRKSRAPSLVARTAISICACPDIITTGAATPCRFKSSSRERPSLPGMTTSERMRSKCRDLANSKAFAALSHTVASCPVNRKARDKEASVLASSSTMRRCAMSGNRPPHISAKLDLVARGMNFPQGLNIIGQFDHESRTASGFTLHADSPPVIADHRLNYRQSQSSAMLFAGVIRSEDALALLTRQPSTGISDFDYYLSIVAPGPESKCSAIRHSIHRIEHQVRQGAVQQVAIGSDCLQILIQLELAGDWRAPWRLQLSLE